MEQEGGTEWSAGVKDAALPAAWLWSVPGKWDRVCGALDGHGRQALYFVEHRITEA